MQDILGKSLKNLKWLRMQKIRITAILLVLSLVVSLDVFWILRQPGLTLAGDATCGIQEHTHDDACGELVLVCELSEEPHVHDETCYETRLVEEKETQRLICEETEEPHLHNEDCHETIINESGEEETVLCCTLESEPHEHTESCFVMETEEAYEEEILICGLSEEGHIHGDDCCEWEMVCGLEEHVHSVSCYSDDTADVETQLDWQEMFADYPYTGDLREDLAGIARTQVGYTESERNFEVDHDGDRHGYTRYGAWYGAPYSDWSAMFVSFCLHYAGADPEENPGNSGANSMAKRWKKLEKYADADAYVPASGDLVFFADNTVGIVTDVHNASFHVICGDLDDEVQGIVLPLTDDSIAGWGLTEGTFSAEEETPMEEDPVEEEIEEEPEDSDLSIPEMEDVKFADLADGPVFQITAKEKAGLWTRLRTNGSALTTAQDEGESETTGPRDILKYLEGCGGRSFVQLLDENDREPKDENGNYVVEAGKSYYVEIVMVSDAGIVPGTYLYNALPAGVEVATGSGLFELKNNGNPIVVGEWEVSSDNKITMVFNEKMVNRSEVVITARMKVHFSEQEDPIKFDGNIIVTVQKPPRPEEPTKLMKYGIQGYEGEEHGKTDPEKIYWTVEIDGNRDSQIPGSLLTDQTLKYDWTYEHRYTDSDIAAGLSFGASVVDPETGAQFWHTWKVYAGDPGLTWTETGWSYQMPEKVVCGCWVCNGNQLTLGNEGWTYYVEYTSTPEETNAVGNLQYVNRVKIDDQTVEGWAQVVQSVIEGTVSKDGVLLSDAGGGKFFWELEGTIPGRDAGGRAVRDWCIQDRMTIVDQHGNFVKYVWNDIDKATVTVTYNGQTITVPNIRDATENDPYAWNVNWSKAENGDGVEDLRQIDFLSRCKCTDETCGLTDRACWTVGYWTADGVWKDHSDYCNCWLETEDIAFTITYETTDTSVIQAYGGMGYNVRNTVLLMSGGSTVIDDDAANVLIPSVLEKEIDSIKDYIVNYHITVNEAMLVLTDGSPLHIRDEMTDTLAYIGGSLVITSVDAAGKTATLKQNVDFTVTYDGSGEETGASGKPVHVLKIDILKPQPVKYILDYDTTFIVPDSITSSIKYDNSATITLWGDAVTDSTDEMTVSDINISAKTYKVDMYKTSASTGEPLSGAVFGLFNEQGGMIDTQTTDDKGWLQFQTNVVEGIILRAHQLYYLQELQAPAGYRIDDTKYWFCFCASKEDSCATCDAFNAEKRVHRIPAEQIGKVDLTNELMSYDLPATGGPGIYPIILCGAVFMIAPLVYGFTRRRKHERRVVE